MVNKTNKARAVTIVSLAWALASLALGLQGAPQQGTVSPEGQVLHILVGKSVIINSQARVTRILTSNPAVVEALATSPTQVVAEGKTAGTGSLILWDETGHSQMLDVIVDLDISGLRTAIEQAYPDRSIDVQADGGRLILSGKVANPQEIIDLSKMAGFYSTQIVSSLTVPLSHDRQVLLEVKFAEVDRSRISQFGVNVLGLGAANTPGAISTQQFGPPSGSNAQSTGGASITGKIPLRDTTTTLTVPDLLNIFLFRPDLNLGATIKALEQHAVLQILAQPNLLALNGQKASFLAGGEFPFPVVQGGQSIGVVTIQFRPFGVKLEFTGTIGSDNVIRLHVAPEVSTLDFTNALTLSGFVVPAISTRKAETEIELKDGQSFGIAGLLDHRAQVQMSKIPGIGDIPILGQLFHSRNINRSNTELMVLVTPHIVDPIRATSPLPPDPKLSVPYLDTPKFDQKMPGHKKVEEPAPPPASK
jgi:pilus assembly protein CpaC